VCSGWVLKRWLLLRYYLCSWLSRVYLGYWPVLLLKMPLEVLEVVLLRALFARTEFVVPERARLWRSPIATRTPGLRQASAVRIPGEI
jgi:hypothetical protein